MKGLVYFCYMLDLYNSAETVSKDMSFVAARPERGRAERSLISDVMKQVRFS